MIFLIKSIIHSEVLFDFFQISFNRLQKLFPPTFREKTEYVIFQETKY
jgi:hypothetical protein